MSNNAFWWSTIDMVRKTLGKEVVEQEEVLGYAFDNKLWQPDPQKVNKLARAELGEAIRARTTTDDDGNEVRCEHVVRVAQKSMFGNIDTAPLEFLHRSLLSRQAQTISDARSIVKDRNYIQQRRHKRFKLFPEIEDLARRDDGRESEVA